MSIIEKAISKLEKEKGRDTLLKEPNNTSKAKPKYTDEKLSEHMAVDSSHEEQVSASGLTSTAPVDDAKVPNNRPSGPEAENAEQKQSVSSQDKVEPGNLRGKTKIHNLPLKEMTEKGIVTPQKPGSHIADEFRAIKRPILMNIDQQGASIVQNANLIMVTSALPGEGKTFSAINLAMSLASEQDRTVLLVDADVTKANAALELGINDDSPGLIDYLEGAEKDLSNVLIQTSIPKLKVLPAGHLHENATELLASENMKRLMQELSDRYSDRVIVFDSPPLLITTEAAVLANLVGQVVFVVASEQSSKEAVEDAIEYIGNDKIIGLLLNKVRKSPLSKIGYGYGYGYGYGQGYGYGNGYREKTRQSRAEKAQVDQQ